MNEDGSMWRAVAGLQQDLAVVRNDMAHVREAISTVATMANDHAGRISKLERWKFTAAGALVAVVFLADHWQVFLR